MDSVRERELNIGSCISFSECVNMSSSLDMVIRKLSTIQGM